MTAAKTTWTVPATVVRVVDGDTLILLLNLGWHITMESRCRLIGINCPEMNTDEGKAAKIFTETVLAEHGGRVTFVSHSLDKYGRPLGQVLLPGGASLNQMLLAMQYAVPMEG